MEFKIFVNQDNSKQQKTKNKPSIFDNKNYFDHIYINQHTCLTTPPITSKSSLFKQQQQITTTTTTTTTTTAKQHQTSMKK